MDKKKLLLLSVSIVILLALAATTKVLFLDHQSNSVSALRVDSVPSADLYINDQIVGKTPYDNEKMTPGEYKIKLVATGVTGTFYPWETKIKLTPESLTYVSRDIGKTDAQSGDQILWLEKLPSDQDAQLAVISDPDGAKVTVDAVLKGTASSIFKDIPPGNHDIIISMDNFADQIIKGQIRPGFRLNAAVKLARSDGSAATNPISTSPATATSSATVASSSASASDSFPRPYVLIKETGTGFLRVRSSPSTTATESSRVKPGEKYALLQEQSGWDQIKLSSSSGWVNDQYVQKFK